jgi:hypothetical protein
MHMARFGQGAFQVPHQIFDRLMFFAGDRSQGTPVMLLRLESDSVEQHRRGHVVRVRDKRYAHPGAHRLILEVQAAGMPAGPQTENECPGNGHAKGDRQNQ